MNTPDTLYIMPCSQAAEMAVKYFASTIPGTATTGVRYYDLGITMLTFQPIPGRWNDQPQPVPHIKIKNFSGSTDSPATIAEVLGNNVAQVANFVANDTIYHIRSTLAGSEIVPPNYAIALILTGRTVTLSAYGAEYTHTFPSSDDLQAWLAILQAGVVEFQKTE